MTLSFVGLLSMQLVACAWTFYWAWRAWQNHKAWLRLIDVADERIEASGDLLRGAWAMLPAEEKARYRVTHPHVVAHLEVQ